MLRNNLYYFKHSRDHQEPTLDEFYMFYEIDPKLDLFVAVTKQIKELLTAIKVMRENNETEEKIEEYLHRLQGVLQKNSNRSEFVCFANACDTPQNHILKNFNLLKTITYLYIQKRPISDLTPREWIQALIDSQASRKKGSRGEKKLIEICRQSNYILVNNWMKFDGNQTVVARLTKRRGAFNVQDVRRRFDIRFAMQNQGKAADLLIKNHDKLILLEAKHQSISGGGQDQKIRELIEIISLAEDRSGIYYVAFLDGTYSKLLLMLTNGQISGQGRINKQGTIADQQKDILQHLWKNPNSYWLNTEGFKRFIEDLKVT